MVTADPAHAATVGVVTETNAEKAIEELKAYEVSHCIPLHKHPLLYLLLNKFKQGPQPLQHDMHDHTEAISLQQTASALWHAPRFRHKLHTAAAHM